MSTVSNAGGQRPRNALGSDGGAPGTSRGESRDVLFHSADRDRQAYPHSNGYTLTLSTPTEARVAHLCRVEVPCTGVSFDRAPGSDECESDAECEDAIRVRARSSGGSLSLPDAATAIASNQLHFHEGLEVTDENDVVRLAVPNAASEAVVRLPHTWTALETWTAFGSDGRPTRGSWVRAVAITRRPHRLWRGAIVRVLSENAPPLECVVHESEGDGSEIEDGYDASCVSRTLQLVPHVPGSRRSADRRADSLLTEGGGPTHLYLEPPADRRAVAALVQRRLFEPSGWTVEPMAGSERGYRVCAPNGQGVLEQRVDSLVPGEPDAPPRLFGVCVEPGDYRQRPERLALLLQRAFNPPFLVAGRSTGLFVGANRGGARTSVALRPGEHEPEALAAHIAERITLALCADDEEAIVGRYDANTGRYRFERRCLDGASPFDLYFSDAPELADLLGFAPVDLFGRAGYSSSTPVRYARPVDGPARGRFPANRYECFYDARAQRLVVTPLSLRSFAALVGFENVLPGCDPLGSAASIVRPFVIDRPTSPLARRIGLDAAPNGGRCYRSACGLPTMLGPPPFLWLEVPELGAAVDHAATRESYAAVLRLNEAGTRYELVASETCPSVIVRSSRSQNRVVSRLTVRLWTPDGVLYNTRNHEHWMLVRLVR